MSSVNWQVGALEKMDSLDAELAERHTDLLTMRHKVSFES